MRFINWNVGIATWLLVSAFALPNTPTSMFLVAATAFLVPVVALFAGVRPGARFLISALALALAALMLLLPGVSAAARVSTLLVAAALFALSLVSPRHGRMATAMR
ncbi:MAG TPA: hypothetical protein VLT47_08490 [Anaeromyxobacteraceae bacterium]|nr:hypothetical protein [Anaeromyxobacteraceae bacterium]